MRTHKVCACAIHAVAGLCMAGFVIAALFVPGHPGWLPATAMVCVLVTLWIAQAHHGEMASRYHSLYERTANGQFSQPTLFVRRPARANVAAMWARGETPFYMAASLLVVIIAMFG